MIDVAQVRADTPSCEALLHFNSAGASIMPQPVYTAVTDHLALEQRIGGYEAHAEASDAVAEFYTEFATLLNASADEIAYIENATRAWDMAFYSLPLTAGDRILTHESEYVSNYLALLQQAERRGLHIDLVPSDEYGPCRSGRPSCRGRRAYLPVGRLPISGANAAGRKKIAVPCVIGHRA